MPIAESQRQLDMLRIHHSASNGRKEWHDNAIKNANQKAVLIAEKSRGYATHNFEGFSVFVVTSGADSGANTFRDACSSPNRIITFDGVGTIELESPIPLSSNLWVCGQVRGLSPRVELRNHGITLSTLDNVLIEHLAIRCGDTYMGGLIDGFVNVAGNIFYSAKPELDFLSNSAHVERVWADGTDLTQQLTDTQNPGVNSFSFDVATKRLYVNYPSADSVTVNYALIKSSIPDPITANDCSNLTIRNCSLSQGGDISVLLDNCSNTDFVDNIVADCYDFPWHPKYDEGAGAHSMGILCKRDNSETDNIDIFVARNLFVHNRDRNPRVSDGEACIAYNAAYDYSIGVSLDCREVGLRGSSEISVIGNHHIETSLVSSNPFILNDGAGLVYFAEDNFYSGRIQEDPWNTQDITTFQSQGDLGDPEVPVPPESISPVTVNQPAAFAQAKSNLGYILENSGVGSWQRDSMDQNYVDEVRAKSTTSDIKRTDADVTFPSLLIPVGTSLVVPSHNISEWVRSFETGI